MVGEHIGTSDWVVIEQERIDRFAEATGDHQWIHVDPERAKDGPFGSTIAHGYLTLSLIPALAWEVYTIEGVRLAINYGANKLRFITPVKVGSRVRAHLVLTGVEDLPDDAMQVATTVTVELEGAAKPAAVAETLSRIYL
ncbi:MaoC family dehydratase [Actinospica durhamensis]|uniref:MaoC family dehydratase n=2 Tax=Actinospica durhamensis TaxID=1508375 RepID=A0A941EPH0_9ACTN|nr:MaoC family dehydratase [Actinospica durhamensis]